MIVGASFPWLEVVVFAGLAFVISVAVVIYKKTWRKCGRSGLEQASGADEGREGAVQGVVQTEVLARVADAIVRLFDWH